MSGKKTLISDSLIITVSRLLLMVLNLSLVAVLGVEGYGVFSYLEYISVACFSLSNLGLTSIFTKESQSENNSIGKILTNFLAIKSSTLVILIFVSHGYLLITEDINIVIINAIYTFLLSCLLDWVFVSYGQIKKLAKHYIVYFSAFLFFIMVSIFLFDEVSVINVRIAQILSLGLALTLYSSWIVVNINGKHFDLNFIKRILPRGINMMISQLIQNGVIIFVTTLIKSSYGLVSLGSFSLVMRVVNMILSLRNMLIAPLTKYLVNSGIDEYINVRRRLFIVSLLFLVVSYSIVLILRFNVNDGSITDIFNKYPDIIDIVLVVLPIPAMVLFTLIDGVVINMYNKQRVYLYSVIASLVVFSIVNLVSSTLLMTIFCFVLFEVMYLVTNRIYINKVLLVDK
ncbi:hypothetical protein [Vibrio anguillarum]|uniref:hypothetical protein n=1 Tax=Vibrio anguillarum TaxID=55601 RepID=UPI0030ED397D